MDTSEQYIKMCDCPEIQGDKVAIRDKDYFISVETKEGAYLVWLPRQDQIQEMLKAHYQKHLKILYDFSLTVSWDINSPEQLWLAFYMHEKHGKMWWGKNVKTWVKED